MPIIVFAGRKGGCGKTTGATNLAAYLASNGERVALLDSDPERQAKSFSSLRELQPSLKQFPFEFVSGDIRRTALSMATEFQWVIVDTPGLDSEDTRRAIVIGDVVVFPCKGSLYDLKTIPLGDDLVAQNREVRPWQRGIIYASEGLAGKTGVRRREEMIRKLGDLRALKWASGVTVKRSAYLDAVEAGAGVTEWDDKVASAEFSALADEIIQNALEVQKDEPIMRARIANGEVIHGS